jgi:signal transduction histidine kinase
MLLLMGKLAHFLNRLAPGLRLRLLALVLLTCAPLVTLTWHAAWHDRRRARAEWRQRAQKLVQLASAEEAKVIGATRQLMLAMGESAPMRSGNPAACQKLVDHLYAAYPRYANLGVVKTNGEVIASARPLSKPSNQSERRYFRRTLDTRAFAVGDFPAHAALAEPTVNFGGPVLDRSGRLQGVVFATLALDWFSRFGSALPAQLPPNASWTELDRDGTILVRYPSLGPRPTSVRRLPGLAKAVFSRSQGELETRDPEGIMTFYAFATMPSQLAGTNLVAVLCIPKDELFAESNEVLLRNLFWLALAASLAFSLGWLGSHFLVLQPVKALVKSSARLASGDLSARTGLRYERDELGQLSRTFDQMAERLELRELARQRATQKLQVLSQRLVEVQESERRQISRELHDEIGQALTAAQLNIQAALQSTQDTTLAPRLQASAEMIEQVLEQVHELSLNLRPSMLDDLGLEPAVRYFTNRQAALTGLEVEFQADPLERRLDPAIQTECFRVAQEALTNVVRHAQARKVAVRLSRQNGHLHLFVRDDGIGFDVAARRNEAVVGASLGLLSMEERAALAGGGLEFHSAPGKGTEVHAWFPLKWSETA